MGTEARQNRINNEPIVYSVGYQGLGLVDLNNLIVSHEITVLVDVRSKPFSRRPEFCRPRLVDNLKPLCRYLWLGDLMGGYNIRQPKWSRGIEILVKMIRTDYENVLLMCLERNFEHCHRQQIVADLAQHKIHHINL